MNEFENILDLFWIGDVLEYARKSLEIHASSIMALLSIGYFPEQAHFKTQFSGVSVEFPAEEILRFHQLRSAWIEMVPVIVWAHPDRAADMRFSTDNKLWVEYWTENRSLTED